jgi:hypothetical protein
MFDEAMMILVVGKKCVILTFLVLRYKKQRIKKNNILDSYSDIRTSKKQANAIKHTGVQSVTKLLQNNLDKDTFRQN